MNSDIEAIDSALPQVADNHGTESDSCVCWNCGGAEFEPLFQAGDFDSALNSYPIRRCRQCDLCYTGEVTDDELATIYSRAYYGSDKAKFLSVIETLVRIGHKRQAKKILDLYHRQQSKSDASELAISVLDIGCGRALLLQEFDKLGADCIGIERSEFPGTSLHEIDIHVGALDDCELSGKRFDIIILWHVLEHITGLGALLEELPRHLNPGGMLVISVPNFLSWQSRFFRQHWFHLDLPRHVTHFEKIWLEKALASMGLETVSYTTFTASQNIYGFIQSSLNKLISDKPNRLYKLLTQSHDRRDWIALAGWSMVAIPLMPIAVLESLISAISHQGATLTIYARKRDHDSRVVTGTRAQ
jgi:2-polyprenyl-3-methyl-5-hydroxy-6-metoxy-1,4-benzoquinol methylase